MAPPLSPERSIRPARASDLDRLIEIGRRSWLSAFAQTAPFGLIAWWVTSDRTATLYRECWPGMHVLEEDGVVIGLVQPKHDEINGLWVHPDRQGSRAGTRLLEAGEKLIRSAGHATSWLTCSAMNPRALAFYRRCGYVETGRTREVHVSGFELEDVRFERRLETREER